MKISLQFHDSIYDCEVIVKNVSGMQSYFFRTTDADSTDSLEIDVESGDFELTLIPQMIDYRSAVDEIETNGWKDRMLKKTVGTLMSFVDRMLLRVGCRYEAKGVQDGDVLTVFGQEYVFGTFDRLELLELLPMAYMFFEVYHNGTRLTLRDAFETNRKEVISLAKKLALLDFGLHLIVTYPFQVGRIKRLSKDKKIKKTLIAFDRMDENARQKILIRKEKYMNT